MPIGQSTGPRVLRHSATRHFKKTPEAVCCMNSYLVVSFSEGGNARHFFFGPLFVAGSRLQAMLFQTFKLAHSAKVRKETGNKKKGACGCFLRRGKGSPIFFWACSALQAPGWPQDAPTQPSNDPKRTQFRGIDGRDCHRFSLVQVNEPLSQRDV